MGVVYRALDTRLDGPVAIKVLPSGQIGDQGRKQRFIQEAKAASALNHPGIITIRRRFSRGNGLHRDGVHRGPDTRAPHPSPWPELTQVLRYAVNIADALAQAHGAGIIHRDLKPSNVMVTDRGG
jgi:serine/threonine protein kinase